MNKLKIITLGLLTLLAACGTKTPEPEEPSYYFRFEADGEAFDYKYECTDGLFGGGCTFGASATGSATHYYFNIYGGSWANMGAQGEVLFYLDKEDVMNMDTIILDGGRNRVYIADLKTIKYGTSRYGMYPPLEGKLIISERTDHSLKGTFEFECYKYFINTGGTGELSDTIMQVRNGSFNVPARFN